MSISHDRLRALLTYDPDTGEFRWNFSRACVKAGDLAAQTYSRAGYARIRVDGKLCYAHRLAWFYVHGRWPENDIDHKNGDRSDNRIANLREATRSQNKANTAARRDSKSGAKGVTAHSATGKWVASICVKGKREYLGLFTTKEAAAEAYAAAARRHFGEFARQ